jgi:hypothetical protein
MSTSSTRRRAAVAAVAVANAEVLEARIAAAEAAEMAKAAVATAEDAAAAATTLREEDADDKDGARSRDSHRHHSVSPSPVRRRGRHHHRGSPPIVQRVIKESGGSTPWPMLSKMNYNDWSLLMKVKLQARQLWDAVEFSDAEFHKDQLALDALLASIPPKMVSSLADKLTAMDAWDSITASRVSIDRV